MQHHVIIMHSFYNTSYLIRITKFGTSQTSCDMSNPISLLTKNNNFQGGICRRMLPLELENDIIIKLYL